MANAEATNPRTNLNLGANGDRPNLAVGSLVLTNPLPAASVSESVTTQRASTTTRLQLNNELIQQLVRAHGTQIQSPHSLVRQSASQPIIKVDFNVRVINPSRKREFETFVLRKVVKESFRTPEELKRELLHQLGSEIVSENHSFGFMKGVSKVTIHSRADIEEVWKSVSRGDSVTLWCHGAEQDAVSDSEEEREDVGNGKKRGSKRRKVSLLEEKNNRVEKLVSTLREKHETKFSTIQYRLWAEMIDVGTHRYISLYLIVKKWNLYIRNYCLFKL